MGRRRPLREGEHRYRSLSGRTVITSSPNWSKGRTYDGKLDLWVYTKEREEQVRERQFRRMETTARKAREEAGEEVPEEEAASDLGDTVYKMKDKFDNWARQNVKGYSIGGWRKALEDMNEESASIESDGSIQVGDYEVEEGSRKVRLIKLRLDPNQKTLYIVMREKYEYKVNLLELKPPEKAAKEEAKTNAQAG